MNNTENNPNELSKKERKILRTKELIIDAAKDLFSKKNFDGISMEEIADSAALSRATLYNYFNTKEEIYFSIGIAQLKQWIEQYESIEKDKYTGIELILLLTEHFSNDILEYPHHSKILRRFFYRTQELELNIENLFYQGILKDQKVSDNGKNPTQSQIFIEILESYINYRRLWQSAINKGIKDGSIKSESNPTHLNFITIMIIFGLLDQIDFRRTLMDIVKISKKQIKGFLLNIVTKLMEGTI